jgi:ferredoxin
VTGSEGTLVTVVEAAVALVPADQHRVIAVGHFRSVPAAIEATADALAGHPLAVELIDRTILELSRQKLEYRALGSILPGDPAALLFVTFTGDTEAEAIAALDRLDRRWQAHRHGYHTLRAVRPADQTALLKVREAGLGLLMAASSGTRRPLAFVEDTAVEPARLAAYTRRFRSILDAHGLTAGFYGHCSVGCLHIRPFVDLTAPGQREVMRAVAEEVSELVIEFGGVNSSEHGDGLARSEFNRRLFGDGLYGAMQEVKRLFDPAGRMNPGKIVDAPPMTDNLRDLAQPVPPPLATRLSFAAPGGMRGVADRCMNIGICRKTATGVMCPSYMATRDEEHSTRGRANALLHALSLPDPAAALGGERLHGILDLCLECKACRSECPLGMDMAALKMEALAVLPASSGVSGHRILLHGHCHQKALAGTAATVGLLRAIPGAEVTEVDAGCCGMAGSFGYEAEHYLLSMRIGELRLFPAIRAEPPDTILAATGVSCRQQIAHGTGRPARHPLEIVRQALG